MPDGGIAEVEQRLRKEIDERIDKQFVRDREFIKETIGAALKILGAALGVVAIVVVILGWKTFDDVNNAVVHAARTTIEKRLNDPTSEDSQTFRGILDRTLVDSYLVHIARYRAYRLPPSRERNIGTNDLVRLTRMLERQELDEENFKDVVTILVQAPGFDQLNRTRDELIALVLATSKKWEWIRAKSERRAFVMERLSERQPSPFSGFEEILKDQGSPAPLKAAVIRYIMRSYDTRYRRELEALIADSDNSVQNAALQALAAEAPDSVPLANWLKKYATGPLNIDSVEKLWSVVNGALSRVRQDSTYKARTELAQSVFKRVALNSNVFLRQWTSSTDPDVFRRELSLQMGSEVDKFTLIRNVPGEFFYLTSRPPVLENLLKDAFSTAGRSDFAALLRMLGAFEQDERGQENSQPIAIWAQLGPKSTIAVSSGQKLQQSRGSQWIQLSLQNRKDPAILASWEDASVRHSELVTSIENGSDIVFQLTVPELRY